VRKNIRLAECPSFGQTIFEYAPHSKGAADYAALAEEIAAMSSEPPAEASEPAADESGRDSGGGGFAPIENQAEGLHPRNEADAPACAHVADEAADFPTDEADARSESGGAQGDETDEWRMARRLTAS
jgi:hypothetical protein